MSGRFANRTTAITGAAGSLARAAAVRLACEGARLFLFDRDEAGLHETARLCPGSVCFVGDVTSSKDVALAAETARRALGAVELLVAAAGILGPAKKLIEVDEKAFDELFAVNVKGAWLTAKYFIPQMQELGRGSVVLFSSTTGIIGSAVISAYSASKGAVTLLARSLALNHARENIRVNCVCPSAIESPMAYANIAQAGDEDEQQRRLGMLRSQYPLNRFGTPDEVAAAVLYLLSDEASYTTGVALPVDGGRLA